MICAFADLRRYSIMWEFLGNLTHVATLETLEDLPLDSDASKYARARAGGWGWWCERVGVWGGCVD